jgi:hypothetical protein
VKSGEGGENVSTNMIIRRRININISYIEEDEKYHTNEDSLALPLNTRMTGIFSEEKTKNVYKFE